MMKKWLNSDILLAGSLFGLAAVLRIFFLSDRYLDIDEAFQIYIAGQPTIGSFFEAMFALGPQQHPLDYVIDFIFFRFIQDAFYLRLLKVFWGCATVVLLYFLGKTLHGKRFGLLWAFLLAISVLHINYSQTIRHYALVTLLSVFSVLSFVRFDTNRTWKISYATAMVLLQLTYPFLIVMGLAEYLFIRWENGEKSRQLLYALIPSWIVALLWEGWSFFSYWTESPQTSLYSPMSFLNWQPIAGTFLKIGQNDGSTLLIYIALFSAGFFLSLTAHKKFSFVCLALFGSVLFTTFISTTILRAPLPPRYVLPVLPFFLWFVAYGILNPFEKMLQERNRLLATGWLGFIVIVLSLTAFPPLKKLMAFQSYGKQIFEDAAQNLMRVASKNDTVILANPNLAATLIYYTNPADFFRIPGLSYQRRFGFFRFKPNFRLTIQEKSIPLYTLCDEVPNLDTLSFDSFQSERKRTQKEYGKIWLISFRFNYFVQPDPFRRFAPFASVRKQPELPGFFLLGDIPTKK